MTFDLTDLRVFAAIAEAKSVTGGAKIVFLSTAAASIRVKALEEELGVCLLDRHNKGVDLTPAGQLLLENARLIEQQIEQVRNQFSSYAEDAVGHVRIVATSTAVTELLPDILKRFLKHRPAVTIDLQEQFTNNIVRSIASNAADIGIVSGQIINRHLEKIHINTDTLVLVTPTAHPLANKTRVKFTEILEYPYISLHSGSALQSFINEKFIGYGRQIEQHIQVFGFDGVCRLIESGTGISIIPLPAVQRLRKHLNIAIVELDEAWAERQRYLIFRNYHQLSSVAKALIKQIVDITKTHHQTGTIPNPLYSSIASPIETELIQNPFHINNN